MYIRLTHVTVRNEQVNVTCVHPYPIDTETNNVIKDSEVNSLYFPVSDDELKSGRKR
jgi:short-subunit dehydrogenase